MRRVAWKATARSTMLLLDGTRHNMGYRSQSQIEAVFCITGMGIDGLLVCF
jgi:hypothetical protein